MAKTIEERLISKVKTGRKAFSVADALGTVGKALVQGGVVLLMLGFGSACLASWEEYSAGKLKRQFKNEQRNKTKK